MLSRNMTAYVYIAPFFALFLVFSLFPIIYSAILSFQYWRGIGRAIPVGFDNYRQLFRDSSFWKALYNTGYIWVGAHLIMLPCAFLFAYALTTDYVKHKNLFQALIFTPMVTSTIAVSLVFSSIFGEKFGLINWLLRAVGTQPVEWFHGTGSMIKPVIIILFIWKWIGWNAVIYYAGMQSIDRELYECATVEGANKFYILRHITIPLMKPVILYTLVMSVIGGLQIFEEPYILTGGGMGSSAGGTNEAGLTIAYLVYLTGFRQGAFGRASALAYLLMLLIVVLTAGSFRMFRDKELRS
jgi:ABC-type sugar transport system permease subunit